MTFKTFFASGILVATFVAPLATFAQEIVPVSESVPAIEVPTLTPTEQLQAELTDLKAKEADPKAGFMTRFFLRIKIKELENKLNIATALK